MYSFEQVQQILALQSARHTVSPPRSSSSSSVPSQPLTSAIFNQPVPAVARSLLNQADLRQCFMVNVGDEQQQGPPASGGLPTQEQFNAALQVLQAFTLGSSAAYAAQVGPRGFTQASRPAADYSPVTPGVPGRPLPPGVCPPASQLPTLQRPAPGHGLLKPSQPPAAAAPPALDPTAATFRTALRAVPHWFRMDVPPELAEVQVALTGPTAALVQFLGVAEHSQPCLSAAASPSVTICIIPVHYTVM